MAASVRLDARSRVRLCAAALLLATTGAAAKPLQITGAADVAAVAERVKAYAGASRVRGVIAAPSLMAARDLVSAVSRDLGTIDHGLAARIEARESATGGPAATARAWIEPMVGQEKPATSCAWQVWVYDPAAPTEQDGPVALPVGPDDRFPVSPSSTFRVGFTGLVQSRIYAFGETLPGGVRDLSKVGDVNIPVARDAETETLVLVKARQPVPQFERIKAALEKSPGDRVRLGDEVALVDGPLGKRRGIGSNLQIVTPDMVVRDLGALGPEDPSAPVPSDQLVETCLFTLVGTDPGGR